MLVQPVVPSGERLAEEEQREDCNGAALPGDLEGIVRGPITAG